MKNISHILAGLLAALLLSCCQGNNSDFRPPAVGPPYEVLIVCADDKWQGELGDTLRSIFSLPVDFINSTEPVLDIMRTRPGTFNDLLKKSRNILYVVTGSEYPAPIMGAEFDVYSSPQLYVVLSGPDERTVTDYISENRESLIAIYNNAERDWTLDLNRRYGDRTISEKIYEKFGVELPLPKGYKIRNSLDDFMWISFEYPTASQGAVIYTYPFTGIDNLSEEWLLYRRNEFVSRIPGENPGSHMTTYDGFLPSVRYFRIGDRDWAEMRGFWEVEGDYMGGPFVSYSTIDRQKGNVITFDFYVYSPDKPKRNFLRPLENLLWSIQFPDGEHNGEE